MYVGSNCQVFIVKLPWNNSCKQKRTELAVAPLKGLFLNITELLLKDPTEDQLLHCSCKAITRPISYIRQQSNRHKSQQWIATSKEVSTGVHCWALRTTECVRKSKCLHYLFHLRQLTTKIYQHKNAIGFWPLILNQWYTYHQWYTEVV